MMVDHFLSMHADGRHRRLDSLPGLYEGRLGEDHISPSSCHQARLSYAPHHVRVRNSCYFVIVMPFGILECHRMELVPGTVGRNPQYAPHTTP